ncbi:MAG: uL15m family ribosomal protein [Nanopusillaceae archaeon]
MTARRSKKYRKYLGKRYARRGYNDRNRYAGNRGGRGKAGWRLKKQKMIKFFKEYIDYIKDKKGFTSPNYKIEKNFVNIEDIEEYFEYLINEGIAMQENEFYVINLNDLGIDKLLGKGMVSRKYKIIVKSASKSAIEKIKALGGEVIISN